MTTKSVTIWIKFESAVAPQWSRFACCTRLACWTRCSTHRLWRSGGSDRYRSALFRHRWCASRENLTKELAFQVWRVVVLWYGPEATSRRRCDRLHVPGPSSFVDIVRSSTSFWELAVEKDDIAEYGPCSWWKVCAGVYYRWNAKHH